MLKWVKLTFSLWIIKAGCEGSVLRRAAVVFTTSGGTLDGPFMIILIH